jgi:hypothetical protein
VAVDGGGWIIVGGHPRPVDPWGPWARINSHKRDALVALAMDEIATYIHDRGTREKVRSALVEGARASMEKLSHSVGESRSGPAGSPARVGRRLALVSGKGELSARRFQLIG